LSTTHRIVYDDSSELSGIDDESVNLVGMGKEIMEPYLE